MREGEAFMQEIFRRIEAIKSRLATEPLPKPTFRCSICKDTEWIWDHENVAKECVCVNQRKVQRLMDQAMIPEEFAHATLENFRTTLPFQQEMMKIARRYLQAFDSLSSSTRNSCGFLAQVGETEIQRETNLQKRSHLQKNYNHYGIGKTHLTVAMSKKLMEKGKSVLILSDVEFMDELARARAEDKKKFERLLMAAQEVDVLVWDDLGKKKTSDFKQGMYYQIINHRHLHKKPILFSTNESSRTLGEKIGPDAFSRLLGMCKKEWIWVGSGEDQRL